MNNLTTAEEVLGELGVSLMIECSEQCCVVEAASVISVLLESDLLVSAYLVNILIMNCIYIYFYLNVQYTFIYLLYSMIVSAAEIHTELRGAISL